MTNKILALIIALVLGLSLVFAVSCGGDSVDTSTNTDTGASTDTESDTNTDTDFVEPEGYKVTLSTSIGFKVTVLDGEENPIQNAVVRFTAPNGEGAMDMTDKNGSVVKTLSVGDTYITVENSSTKANYYLVAKELNEQGAIFYAYNELSSQRVSDNGTPDDTTDDRIAYVTREAGTYYATGLKDGNVIFFLFIPSSDGIYSFSMSIEGEVGYYGAPINAIQSPIAPFAENGVLSLEIKNKNLGETAEETTPYLIGIKASSENIDEALFTIKRTGDPVYTDADVPYTGIENPNAPKTEKLNYKNWAITLTDVDITKEVTIVKGEDGYYHLNSEDGPVVYIRITTESQYLPSFQKICETSLMGAYIRDENGALLRKEMYNTLINQYANYADSATGILPLDDYMITAVKNHGEGAGWWKQGSPNYLFGGAAINESSAWMFACVTVTVDKNAGLSQENSIKVEKSLPDSVEAQIVTVNGATTLYFEITSPVDSKLKVTGCDDTIKVIYNGEEYTKNSAGNIEISIAKATALTFEIVYSGEGEREISFTIS